MMFGLQFNKQMVSSWKVMIKNLFSYSYSSIPHSSAEDGSACIWNANWSKVSMTLSTTHEGHVYYIIVFLG